jgi:histidyl-tRNA synthetase
VRATLDGYGVAYELVPTLVRGLDYYTRTTWEFVGPEHGAQSSISGGGRYDYLVEEIGGPPTPGVGFGAGIERLLLALEDAGVTAAPEPLDVFVAVERASERSAVLALLLELRRRGVSADVDYAGRSLKGQLGYGRKAAGTVVVWKGETAEVRRRGELDVEVPVDQLVDRLTA